MDSRKVWLITPPFTQVNTPYPATCYLKGFLSQVGVPSFQSDLSLEIFLKVFSLDGLSRVFEEADHNDPEMSENAFRIWSLKERYLSTVDLVISFLQSRTATLAYQLSREGFLPQAGRFKELMDLDLVFGELGLIDQAKYMSTLYLEDLSDFIREVIDPHFGFSRYAEKLCSSVSDFSLLDEQLRSSSFLTMLFLEEILIEKFDQIKPDVVAITIPFPGNLFAALKIGQILKSVNPEIAVVAGGGYCNTELRSVFDIRVFNYFDFIVLDDGERPIQLLLEYLDGRIKKEGLKRTFLLHENTVRYCNQAEAKDVPQRDTGIPDYSDLLLEKYLSILEVLNPMHRLWSDGRWNKLTMAHGCYWGKCTFCDVTLDYIARYEPLTAKSLCDRVEQLIIQTGERGFHFVDEAAPPALMRDMAIEIMARNLRITWWTNIRFEKAFTPDLCRLLAASGCVAVSGGLEVASDRLLAMISKGVTIEQVAKVTRSFRDAGILVHAYLMYGFPTQSDQETIDALEIVRQLFKKQVVHSAFWHLFSMTAHSPVGRNPAHFGVEKTGPVFQGFAENDLQHIDPTGTRHTKYSEGLKHSLYNYMHGLGLDEDLSIWFPFSTPRTTISRDYIDAILRQKPDSRFNSNAKVIWIGGEPIARHTGAGNVVLEFFENLGDFKLEMTPGQADWLLDIFHHLILEDEIMHFERFKNSYEENVGDFNLFLRSNIFARLRRKGLLIV